MELAPNKWNVQYDQHTKRYIIITPNRYCIAVQGEQGLISLLAFLASRDNMSLTAYGEPLRIDEQGIVSCSHPDPWLNKDFRNGVQHIAYADEIANCASKALKELEYVRVNNSSR